MDTGLSAALGALLGAALVVAGLSAVVAAGGDWWAAGSVGALVVLASRLVES